MSPDKRPRPKSPKRRAPTAFAPRTGDEPYQVVYLRRHAEDDPEMSTPGREFLRGCPDKVRATMAAVLTQVAASPPHRFSGGGYWEAMHGAMTGYHEIRVDGRGAVTIGLFCLLDNEARGLGPLLIVIAGADKPFRTTFGEDVYADVRRLAEEYKARQPRSLA